MKDDVRMVQWPKEIYSMLCYAMRPNQYVPVYDHENSRFVYLCGKTRVRTLAWQSATQTKKHSRVQSVHTPLDLGTRRAQLEAHAARLDALAELLHVAHPDGL